MMPRFILSISILIFSGYSALAQGYDIAVVRDRHSALIEQIYFAFATTTNKKIINFDLQPGKEAEIAKGIQVQGARAVFIAGDATPAMLNKIDNKIPVLTIHHGVDLPADLREGRVLVELHKDPTPSQILTILSDLFPDKKRLGFAYNPKLTQTDIDAFRRSDNAKDYKLVLLKVDQPTDLMNLLPTFRGQVDLFLMLMDATLIKAGTDVISKSLSNLQIPLVSACEQYNNAAAFMSIEVEPFTIGRNIADILERMTAGQTTFRSDYQKRDIVVGISLTEAVKLKWSNDRIVDLLSRAQQAGYRVNLH